MSRVWNLRDLVRWPRTAGRHLPAFARRRLFEVWDRTWFAAYRCPRGRRLPVYVGPVSYDRRLGWRASWRGAVGVEAGVAGRHLIAAWWKPGAGHWFWRRVRV